MSTNPTFLKNFLDWFNVKPKVDLSNHQPPLIEEGNIWWCRIGENIGTKISGKGREYTRPVVIHTKFSRYLFLVIPLTTKLFHLNGKSKEGDYYVKVIQNKVEMLACLNQVRVVDYRRFKNKLGDLDEVDFLNISNKLTLAFQKSPKISP